MTTDMDFEMNNKMNDKMSDEKMKGNAAEVSDETSVESSTEKIAAQATAIPGDASMKSMVIAGQQSAEQQSTEQQNAGQMPLEPIPAKQFLKDARLIDELIEDHEEQLLRMKSKLTQTTPFYGERMGGKSSGGRRDPSDKILRFTVMEAEYRELIQSFKALKAIIADQVTAVADDKQRQILALRYLQHGGWQEIAENLRIDRKWVWILEQRAIREIHTPKRYLDIKPPNGSIWHESTVMYILQSEKYIGEMRLQKTYVEDHLSKCKKRNKGERCDYYVFESHEPIIARDVYDEVQRLIALRREKYGASSETPARYVLSGIIQCAECGAHYQRKISNSGTKHASPVWVCGTKKLHGKGSCSGKQIPEPVLMTLINEHSNLLNIEVTGSNEVKITLDDGTSILYEWTPKSRRDSWDEEARKKASDRTKMRCVQ